MKYDTHMHLDLYKNREEIIKYIEKEKSYTLAMTNLPILFESYLQNYKGLKYIRFALGFHPELLIDYSYQFEIFIKNIKNTRYIGEIGLDYSKTDAEEKPKMVKLFSEIIRECRKTNDKILSVHSRKSATDVIDIIDKFKGKVILHWFTGNLKELDQAIYNGYYFSINHQMVSSKSGMSIIKKIPVDRILIESDAPFTEGLKGKYNLKFYDKIINSLINELNIDKDTLIRQLSNNFRTLLGK